MAVKAIANPARALAAGGFFFDGADHDQPHGVFMRPRAAQACYGRRRRRQRSLGIYAAAAVQTGPYLAASMRTGMLPGTVSMCPSSTIVCAASTGPISPTALPAGSTIGAVVAGAHHLLDQPAQPPLLPAWIAREWRPGRAIGRLQIACSISSLLNSMPAQLRSPPDRSLLRPQSAAAAGAARLSQPAAPTRRGRPSAS